MLLEASAFDKVKGDPVLLDLQRMGDNLRNQAQDELAQDELGAVRNGAWGQAVLLVKKRLDQIQTNCRNRRLSEWNKYVHTIPGACRWVQRESPPPMVLENSGKVVTSHGEAAEVLHSAWGEVFGCNTPLV